MLLFGGVDDLGLRPKSKPGIERTSTTYVILFSCFSREALYATKPLIYPVKSSEQTFVEEAAFTENYIAVAVININVMYRGNVLALHCLIIKSTVCGTPAPLWC